MSGPTLKVLATMLGSSASEMAGVEIGRSAKILPGTLYPILLRLEHAGWLVSRWETESPQDLGRPRKRFYRLTGLGATKARAAFRELEPAFGRLSLA